MKKLFLLPCLAAAAFAAEPTVNKSFVEELERKARALAFIQPAAEKLLPADTLGFFTVPDWTKAQAAFTNSTSGQLWADPAMQAFKESFLEKFNAEKIQPLEKELGFQFTNFLNLARGQFTLGVVPNGWDGRSERQPGLLWLLDVKENSPQLKTNLAALRKQWTESGRKLRVEKIHDVEFTVVIVDAQEIGKSLQQLAPGPKATGADAPTATRSVEWVIGQSGSLLMVSDAARDVEKVLARQSGAAEPALAEQSAFKGGAELLRGAQSFAWVNVKPIMNTLARQPAQRTAGKQSPLAALPTVEKILNALGLNGVQTLAYTWQPGADGTTTQLAVRVPASGRKGLFHLLAVGAQDAAPPPFIPADAVKFTRWRMDLQKVWSTIETMLLEVSPQYAGFSKLILDTAGKDKDPNFDFRKQLLANLGDDVITFEKAPRAGATSAAPRLVLIGSKNAVQMAASLRAITSIFPPEMIQYGERDSLGRKIYSVVIPSLSTDGKPRPLTYAASGGHVVISSEAGALEEFLRASETPAKPLRERPGVNDAAQKIGGTGRGYYSFENRLETARAAFANAKDNPSALTEVLGAGQLTTVLGWLGSDGQSTADLLDATKLPAFEKVAKYFHFDVSAMSVTPEGITFQTFTPAPPALRK